MAEIPPLQPPWSRLALVRDDTALFDPATMEALDEHFSDKADGAAVAAALATKADTATVDAALAAKADAAATTAALATKANASSLAAKADTSTVNAALATKADAEATTAALATKVDAAQVDAAIGTQVSTRGTVAQTAIDSLYQRFRPRTGLVNLHYADKPVVTLRADDSSAGDYTIATELTKRGMVGTFALIWGKVWPTGEAGATTLAQYQEMQRNGHQLAVHARTQTSHDTAPADYNAFFDEIITVPGEMLTQGLYGEHWVEPGPWGAGDESNPYYFNTYAKLDGPFGRILQSRYQTSNAYIQDAMTGNTGAPRPIPAFTEHGAHHATFETGTVADMIAQIEKLKSRPQASSIQILTHGQRVGTAGYITWADYYAFLDYLAAERDAGRIYIMTEGAALRARPGARINLFGDPGFEQYASSPAKSEWLTGSSAPTVVAGETSGSALRLATGLNGRVYQVVRGVDSVRSLEVTARVRMDASSTAGTGVARVLVQYTGGVGAANTDLRTNITVAEGWKTIRANFGLMPGATAATVQIISNTSNTVLDIDNATLRVT